MEVEKAEKLLSRPEDFFGKVKKSVAKEEKGNENKEKKEKKK